MRRIFTLAALTAALLLPTNANAHDGHPNWRYHECRFQGTDGRTGWSPQEVRRTIACLAPRFGVSTSTALTISYRESHWLQYATNSSSGACGVFQHIPRYFPGRLASVPDSFRPWGTSCYDARSNVLAAMVLARSGWSAWSTY